MDRTTAIKNLSRLQQSMANDPDYSDMLGHAPELKWLMNEYCRLVEVEMDFKKEVVQHEKTRTSYSQTARKLKRFKDRMTQIRKIAESKNPSIKDIRYLANGYEMRNEE